MYLSVFVFCLRSLWVAFSLSERRQPEREKKRVRSHPVYFVSTFCYAVVCRVLLRVLCRFLCCVCASTSCENCSALTSVPRLGLFQRVACQASGCSVLLCNNNSNNNNNNNNDNNNDNSNAKSTLLFSSADATSKKVSKEWSVKN
jgi:hypothetical protein